MSDSEDELASPVAAHVIAKCGGVKAVAEMVGVTPKQVYCWTYTRKRGGTGGRIPHDHQDKLLTAAQAKSIDLTAADFFESSLPPDEAAA